MPSSPNYRLPARDFNLADGLLDIRTITVDIMPDGAGLVGKPRKPAAGALFQLAFPAVCVLCSLAYRPNVGSMAATVYINDGRERLVHPAPETKLQPSCSFHFDKTEETGHTQLAIYRATIMMWFHRPRLNHPVAHAGTYLLDDIIRHEMIHRGHARPQVLAAHVN